MSSDDLIDYTDANRQAWNELEFRHRASRFEMLADCFAKPGYNYLGEVEREVLENLGVQGKDVAQLACNNGREILSIRNMGAARCVGFDISDGFIRQGKCLAEIGKIEAELVACDVYRIPPVYYDQFDIVFVSVGLIDTHAGANAVFSPWVNNCCARMGTSSCMNDIRSWTCFIGVTRAIRRRSWRSYYRKKPFVRTTPFDYWAKETYDSSTMYTFHHTLTDVFGGLMDNGFALERFQEYEHDISEMFAHFSNLKLKPPMCYVLVARIGEG